MDRLHQLALDIEFLIISVIQGVVLAALASIAAGPLGALQIEYIPYIVSAFLLILTFWTQAVVHALSFVDWPLDITHTFLYFLASFVEVMAFSHLTDPTRWFGFVNLFFIVAAILYMYDLSIIKKHRHSFSVTKHKKELYKHIEGRQHFEYKKILPAGFIFSFISLLLIILFPTFFITQKWHIALGLLQALFGIVILIDVSKSFMIRSELITKTH